jgi:glycosyltransferase involved in cell wall biosynthesis
LPESIACAYAQTYDNIEIILYDNFSSEDIKSLADQYDDRLRYYRSDVFLTLGQARNAALALAKGELIDYLDSDDLFSDDKIEKFVPHFEYSEVGLVTCNTTFFRDKNEGRETRTMYSAPIKDGKIFGDLLKSYNLSFVATMFRKSAIGDDPKNWFPTQFNICTDYDLFLKISHGYQVKYIHEELCMWRQTGDNWSIRSGHLTPLEMLMMIARIEVYEPHLFKNYRAQMNCFLANVYSKQYYWFWERGVKMQAFMLALQCFLLTFFFGHLLRSMFILVFSYGAFESLKLKLLGRNSENL